MDNYWLYVAYFVLLVIVGVFEYIGILSHGMTETLLLLIIGHFFGSQPPKATSGKLPANP